MPRTSSDSMEPSDHWLLSNAALKYLDIPIEEKESDHKRD